MLLITRKLFSLSDPVNRLLDCLSDAVFLYNSSADFCTISGTNSLNAALKMLIAAISNQLWFAQFANPCICSFTTVPIADWMSGDINKIMRLQLNNILWLTLNQIEYYIAIYTKFISPEYSICKYRITSFYNVLASTSVCEMHIDLNTIRTQLKLLQVKTSQIMRSSQRRILV